MIINSQQSLDQYMEQLKADFKEYRYLDADHKTKGKARTSKQNAALHKYCDEMAYKLNLAGVEYVAWEQYKKARGIETQWTMELFKGVFKDYAGAMFPECLNNAGEPKTSKLTRKQMTEAYELVNERMSTIFGQGQEWPKLEMD